MLKVLRQLLAKLIDDIDADNTHLEEDDMLEIIDKLKELRNKEIVFSKY